MAFPSTLVFKTYLLFCSVIAGYSSCFCNFSLKAAVNYHKKNYPDEPYLNILTELQATLKEIVENSPKVKSKNPCIFTDLAHIIKCIPENYLYKARIVSNILFAYNSGARLNTVHNLKYGDFVFIKKDADGIVQKIGFTYRVTKTDGERGCINIAFKRYNWSREHDIFYWLDRHMKNTIGIGLNEINLKNLSEDLKNTFVWKESCVNIFKTCVHNAGYDKDFLSYQSLRIGFLCAEVIRAAIDDKFTDDFLLRTAMICGWSQTQKTYIKNVVMRLLLIDKIVVNEDDSAIITDLWKDPVKFHNLSGPLVSKWENSNYPECIRTYIISHFMDKLNKAFDTAIIFYNQILIRSEFKLNYRCLIDTYAKTDHVYYNTIVNEIKIAKENGFVGDLYAKTINIMYRIIDDDLVANYEINYKKHCDNLKTLMDSCIDEWIIKIKRKAYEPSIDDVRFMEYGNFRRWSNEELLMLVKGVNDGLDYHQIRIKGRTPHALQKAYRALSKRFNNDVLKKVASGEITVREGDCEDTAFIKEINVEHNKSYVKSKLFN